MCLCLCLCMCIHTPTCTFMYNCITQYLHIQNQLQTHRRMCWCILSFYTSMLHHACACCQFFWSRSCNFTQFVALCCSAFQCVAVRCRVICVLLQVSFAVLQCVAGSCVQCVAVCCSVLHLSLQNKSSEVVQFR